MLCLNVKKQSSDSMVRKSSKINSMLLGIFSLLGLLLLLSALFQRISVSVLAAFLLSGFLIGPGAFGVLQFSPQLSILGELSASLLLFTIGLEFSWTRLKRMGKNFAIISFSQVLFCFILSIVFLNFFFELELRSLVLIAFLTSFSSTAMAVRELEEHRETRAPHGKASLSTLLFQDLLVIPLLMFLPFFAGSASKTPSLWVLGASLLAIGATVKYSHVFVRKILLPLVRVVATLKSRELIFLAFLVFCGVSALALSLIHI